MLGEPGTSPHIKLRLRHMKRLDLRDQWVLVTGASSGIGRDMAVQLARDHGAHVVAVARRAERLDALKTELESEFGVRVLPVVADLSTSAGTERVIAAATQEQPVVAAILNAGVTYYGRALELSDETFEAMLATNVTGLVRIANAMARFFIATQKPGGILLVSSMGCFAPLPYQTAYAATKSFVTSYGRGLATELKGTGVSVSVYTPGGVNTELIESSGLSRQFSPDSVGMMNCDVAARVGLNALVNRKALSIPGALNHFLALAFKLLPHGMLLPRIGATYAGGLPEHVEPPGPDAASPTPDERADATQAKAKR